MNGDAWWDGWLIDGWLMDSWMTEELPGGIVNFQFAPQKVLVFIHCKTKICTNIYIVQ